MYRNPIGRDRDRRNRISARSAMGTGMERVSPGLYRDATGNIVPQSPQQMPSTAGVDRMQRYPAGQPGPMSQGQWWGGKPMTLPGPILQPPGGGQGLINQVAGAMGMQPGQIDPGRYPQPQMSTPEQPAPQPAQPQTYADREAEFNAGMKGLFQQGFAPGQIYGYQNQAMHKQWAPGVNDMNAAAQKYGPNYFPAAQFRDMYAKGQWKMPTAQELGAYYPGAKLKAALG